MDLRERTDESGSGRVVPPTSLGAVAGPVLRRSRGRTGRRPARRRTGAQVAGRGLG